MSRRHKRATGIFSVFLERIRKTNTRGRHRIPCDMQQITEQQPPEPRCRNCQQSDQDTRPNAVSPGSVLDRQMKMLTKRRVFRIDIRQQRPCPKEKSCTEQIDERLKDKSRRKTQRHLFRYQYAKTCSAPATQQRRSLFDPCGQRSHRRNPYGCIDRHMMFTHHKKDLLSFCSITCRPQKR